MNDRRLKRLPPGTRLGVLKDSGPPWVEAVTVGYVAASVPLLGVPHLQGDDSVDGRTVRLSLALRKEEEKEAKEEASSPWIRELMVKDEAKRRRKRRKEEKSSRKPPPLVCLPALLTLGDLDVISNVSPGGRWTFSIST